jgi:hypothetical protein
MTLPLGTEPLQLADGTMINPISGAVMSAIDSIVTEVPNTEEMQRDIVASRKRIHDLPVPPKQMNTLSLVLMYSLFGLDNSDISNILSIDIEQLQNIKMNDAYNTLSTQIVNTIVESDTNSIRDIFAMNSRRSAQLFVDTVANPEMGITTRMTAANNILDRAGHRAADIVEHRHKVEGGLTIEYIKNDEQDIPTIDITPQEVL